MIMRLASIMEYNKTLVMESILCYNTFAFRKAKYNPLIDCYDYMGDFYREEWTYEFSR